MIGVTRKQRWRRRSDDTVRSAQYRYYQCESRTNRSLCDYHTHRAERLEGEVRTALLSGETSPAVPQAGDGAAVMAETEAQIRRLRDKVRRLDRRLEQYLDAASAGRISEERLRTLSVGLATQQLELEEGLVESQRLAQQQATEAERRRQREQLLTSLRDDWERQGFAQRQELLR